MNLMRLDGSVFPAIVISSVIYSNGKPVGLRGAIVDITERKRAEEQLQETLQSLRKAVSATIQVMVSAVEVRDPYTAGHQIRSADLALSLPPRWDYLRTRSMESEWRVPSMTSGNYPIPAEILSKPTKLTDIEYSLIKEHCLKRIRDAKGCGITLAAGRNCLPTP